MWDWCICVVRLFLSVAFKKCCVCFLIHQHLPWFLKVCECICVCSSVCARNSEELQEYMESKGAPPPGILTLTTSLSKPFTRLERFPMLLKELDRHMEVSLNLSVFVVFYLTCTDTYQ